jgi:hypothetical protein
VQTQAEARFKRKEVQARDGAKAMAEYEAERATVGQKIARLRALRLGKEAADKKAAEGVAAAKAAKPKRAKKKP